MLKRYQVLLNQWIAEYARLIAEKYDVSFSESIRIGLSLQIIQLVSIAYPSYKTKLTAADIKKVILAKEKDELETEELHRFFSNVYFEGRKAMEYWKAQNRKKKKNNVAQL